MNIRPTSDQRSPNPDQRIGEPAVLNALYAKENYGERRGTRTPDPLIKRERIFVVPQRTFGLFGPNRPYIAEILTNRDQRVFS